MKMAREARKVYDITSDLSGTALTEDNAYHVKFMIVVDGESRRAELDVSGDELAALNELLKPYGDAVGGWQTGTVEIGRAGVPATDKARNEKIRAWARDKGPDLVWNGQKLGEVSDRGRLSKHVQDAYAAIEEGDGSAPVEQTANGNGEAAPVATPEFQDAKPAKSSRK